MRKNRRNICFVTSTRAEFGLLTPLMKQIRNHSDFDLQLIVTGTHLSAEFGGTIKEVEAEFSISKQIEIVLSSDSPIANSKSMGLAQISFAEAYFELKPDIIFVLGDRFELLPIVSSAMMARIPVAHISGGEITEGAIDDSVRHCVSKMSHLHFTATEEYRKRVIQLGENPNFVFSVGEPGLDNISELELLSKKEFQARLDFKLRDRNLLVTFHPATLERECPIDQCKLLLEVINNQKNTAVIFTKANADTGGREINFLLENYVKAHGESSILVSSLGQLLYLSALQHVDAVVGNSSSGLVEAPSFNIGTINIGGRQKGRVRANSVIDAEATVYSIKNAFDKLYSVEFQNLIKTTTNPYGNGKSSIQIVNILKNLPTSSLEFKKFHDVDFGL